MSEGPDDKDAAASSTDEAGGTPEPAAPAPEGADEGTAADAASSEPPASDAADSAAETAGCELGEASLPQPRSSEGHRCDVQIRP